MSSLAERLQAALDRRPMASQAGLAAFCGVKPPSVSAWFTGETKSLKATSLRKAAEYLGCDRDWLETGIGLPGWVEATNPVTCAGPQEDMGPVSPAPAEPTLEQALPLVLDAITGLSPMQWSMVRGALEQLQQHPELRDDAITLLLPALQAGTEASRGKQPRAA